MESLSSYVTFLELPSGVVYDILTCWLELKSVCKLDTAYCETQQRARLVELCQENAVVFTLTPNIRSWDYIQWVVKRRLKIANVEFPLLVNERICSELFNFTGMHFRKLILEHTCLLKLVGSSCPNLTHAEVRISPMDASFRAVIAGCSLLESLEFEGIGFGDTMNDATVWFDGIVCSKLSTLKASYGCDRLFMAISKSCPNLTSLDCKGAHFTTTASLTDRGIQALANSPISLVSLKIGFSNALPSIHSTILSIAKPTLVTLELNDLELTEQEIVQLVRNCPNIKEITFWNMDGVTERCLEVIADELPLITKLKLVKCGAFTDQGFLRIAEKCLRLQVVIVDGNTHITEHSLLKLAQNCSQLREIHFGNVAHLLEDSFLYVLAENCLMLSTIYISFSPMLTDDGVCALVKKCVNLSSIYLGKSITDKSLRAIAEYCKLLKVLDTKRCVGVTVHGVTKVVEACKDVRQLHVRQGLLSSTTKVTWKTQFPLLNVFDLF